MHCAQTDVLGQIIIVLEWFEAMPPCLVTSSLKKRVPAVEWVHTFIPEKKEWRATIAFISLLRLPLSLSINELESS